MHSAFVVGAGSSGFLHALALRSAGVRIEAVFDPDAERARDLAAVTGAKVVPTLDFDGDVVAICSPPQHHVSQATALARPGRLVFLEKPVACDRSGLAQLAALPNVVPVLQWRMGQAAAMLREAFAADAFGPRPHVDCELSLLRDATYRARTAEWGCDALLSIGVHALDLVLFGVGRPVVASRVASSPSRGCVFVTFSGGATARMTIDLDGPARDRVRLAVHGAPVSAELLAGEADPTSAALRFSGPWTPRARGATGSPLLVPLVHAALASFERGAPFLGIVDVAAAHALALTKNGVSTVEDAVHSRLQ